MTDMQEIKQGALVTIDAMQLALSNLLDVLDAVCEDNLPDSLKEIRTDNIETQQAIRSLVIKKVGMCVG